MSLANTPLLRLPQAIFLGPCPQLALRKGTMWRYLITTYGRVPPSGQCHLHRNPFKVEKISVFKGVTLRVSFLVGAHREAPSLSNYM